MRPPSSSPFWGCKCFAPLVVSVPSLALSRFVIRRTEWSSLDPTLDYGIVVGNKRAHDWEACIGRYIIGPSREERKKTSPHIRVSMIYYGTASTH